MRVVGIIAEYDPFHLGHLYHLRQARLQAQADYVVCVICSAFTQRGMPGLFATQDRARMALAAGADLVLGMPVSYSCAQANRFAMGGVGILSALGVVSQLSFGVEASALPHLSTAARQIAARDAGFLRRQRAGLSAGQSLARARSEAMADHPGQEALRRPNFVLGLCYLDALDRLGSQMQPLPIPRSSDYHAQELASLPSATAVRRAILEGRQEAVRHAVPESVWPLIEQRMRSGGLHPPEALDKALIAKLLQGGDYADIAEISEGLDQLILQRARQATSREALIALVKSKRYPWTRINRALTGMLLGLEKQPLTPPGYARLLGFKQSALPLLGAIKQGGFPLISRPAKAREAGIQQDMVAEMLWRLGAGEAPAAAYAQDMIKA